MKIVCSNEKGVCKIGKMYEIFSQVLELIFLISVLKPYLQSQASGDSFACSKDVQEEPSNIEHIFGTRLDAVVCMWTLASVTRQYSDKYTQTTDIYIITYTASTPTYTQYLCYGDILNWQKLDIFVMLRL